MAAPPNDVRAHVADGVEAPPRRWRKLLPWFWFVLLVVCVGSCAQICTYEFPPVGHN